MGTMPSFFRAFPGRVFEKTLFAIACGVDLFRQKTTLFDKLLVFSSRVCYAIGVTARVFHG